MKVHIYKLISTGKERSFNKAMNDQSCICIHVLTKLLDYKLNALSINKLISNKTSCKI